MGVLTVGDVQRTGSTFDVESRISTFDDEI
jgi:hypothetical protein